MNVDFIIRFESGEVEDDQEIIDNFQKMIDDGTVWHLQGSYGRMAKQLIENGYCHLPNHETRDAYGNRVS